MIAHNQLLLTHLLLTLKYQSLSMIAHTPNYCSHASIVHDQLLRTRKYCVDSITAQLFYCSRLTHTAFAHHTQSLVLILKFFSRSNVAHT